MDSYVDVTGQEVKPGDFILYASSAGRSAILKFGIVTKLGLVAAGYAGSRERCVLAITVDYWPGGNVYPETDGFEIQNKGKPVRLTYSSRIFIIPTDRVPTTARELLIAAHWKLQTAEKKGTTNANP